MEKFCCTFAGHSTAPDCIKEELIDCIEDLVKNKNVTTFFVGNHGNFDAISASAVRTVKRKFQNISIKLVLVIPKMNTTITNQKEYFENMYDEILIPAESDSAHYKAMITIRNRWMVEHSEYIITYIRREHGGAYTTYKYAKKQNIHIIEL